MAVFTRREVLPLSWCKPPFSLPWVKAMTCAIGGISFGGISLQVFSSLLTSERKAFADVLSALEKA